MPWWKKPTPQMVESVARQTGITPPPFGNKLDLSFDEFKRASAMSAEDRRNYIEKKMQQQGA